MFENHHFFSSFSTFVSSVELIGFIWFKSQEHARIQLWSTYEYSMQLQQQETNYRDDERQAQNKNYIKNVDASDLFNRVM